MLSTAETELHQRRGRFLQEIARLFPECLTRLRDDALPAFVDRAKLENNYSQKSTQDRKGYSLTISAPLTWQQVKKAGTSNGRILPQLVPLRNALEQWADDFGLTEADFSMPSIFTEPLLPQHIARNDWGLDTALRTLAQWEKVPPTDELAWSFLGVYGASTLPKVPDLLIWHPGFETAEMLEQRFAANKDAVIAAYREAGWGEPSEKRNLNHFALLVLRQAGRYSAEYLSEALAEMGEKGAGVRGMKDDLKEDAIKMRLNPREISSGRRPKSAKAQAVKEIKARLARRNLRPESTSR